MDQPGSASSAAARTAAPMHLAVVGAGPVGLSLALLAARALPQLHITVFDARPVEHDVSGDPRTLALSLGSVQMLRRLGVWPTERAQPIRTVHVSQQPPTWTPRVTEGEPALRMTAEDEAVPMLGAVLRYGEIVAPLQEAWRAAEAAQPRRLHTRFGRRVDDIQPRHGGVEVDAGIADSFDLAVIAEGGVFADQARKAVVHDYGQRAWVGTVSFGPDTDGIDRQATAYERFTRRGPVALLPLRPATGPDEHRHDTPGNAPVTRRRAAPRWCGVYRRAMTRSSH